MDFAVFFISVALIELVLGFFYFILNCLYLFPGFSADIGKLLVLLLTFLIKLSSHFDFFSKIFRYLVELLFVAITGLVVFKLVVQSGDLYSAFFDPIS